MSGLFVTGTDTGVGKTVVSVALMQALAQRGLRVAGFKPVASGCSATPGGLRNDDAQALMDHSAVTGAYELFNPFALRAAVAPHLAAAADGVTIDLETIEDCYRRLARDCDLVLVEGAGGWRVPLGGGIGLWDVPRRLGLAVVLVVGIRLGCLNHARLSAEAIRGDGLELAGWVANAIDPGMACFSENVQTLRESLGAPLLGVLPLASPLDYAALAKRLNVGALLPDAASFESCHGALPPE